MKIAGIAITFNDGYKIKEWKSHYDVYRKELDYYVIVDNGSEEQYLSLLKGTFPDEIIIEREENGGCTAAYNDAIKYILNNTDADAIVIIANDNKLTENCILEMGKYLETHPEVGIVSTAILQIDSDIIDNYGHDISYFGIIKENERGKRISEVLTKEKYTDLATGGFYMASRQYYKKVGLQDEKLFMYSDEIDTAIRTKKAGLKIAVLSNVYAWHQHIYQPGFRQRKPACDYLICRNRVYIGRKHFGFFHAMVYFLMFTILIPLRTWFKGAIHKKPELKEKARYAFMGGINGLRGKMEMNKYTQF